MLGSHNLETFVLTTDPERAKAFYGSKLGLQFVSQDNYAVVFNCNGIMLRVTIMPKHAAEQHTVLGWKVSDIASVTADLVNAGVQFEKYSFLEQDELGIWTAPGGAAKVAWFKDPDGNVLSLSQH